MADLPAAQNESSVNAQRSPQQFIKNVSVQKMIEERLGAKAQGFTTSLLSLINSSDKIAECAPITIVQAALTAAAMDLPINQNLSFAYIVPYRNHGKMEAQFQMGWKGFVQLAQRSGQFRFINTSDVREGEIVSRNRLSGAIEFSWIENEEEREKTPIIGYVSYFELMNGFSSTYYMSEAQIDEHARKYSQSFKSGFGPWKDNRPAMSKKTVLKLNLSANAPLSTEPQLQQAINLDQAVQDDKGARYVDGREPLEGEIADEQTKDDIVANATGVKVQKKPAE